MYSTRSSTATDMELSENVTEQISSESPPVHPSSSAQAASPRSPPSSFTRSQNINLCVDRPYHCMRHTSRDSYAVSGRDTLYEDLAAMDSNSGPLAYLRYALLPRVLTWWKAHKRPSTSRGEAIPNGEEGIYTARPAAVYAASPNPSVETLAHAPPYDTASTVLQVVPSAGSSFTSVWGVSGRRNELHGRRDCGSSNGGIWKRM